MPRRSSGGFGGRSSPPPRQAPAAQRPAPVQRTPPPAQQAPAQSGGMFSGLGGMVMSGMAFGVGSEVAHQAIRAVTGSGSHSNQAPVEQQQQQQQQQPQNNQQQQVCGDEMGNFSTCLKSQQQISMCQPYLDVLKECQKRSGQ